MSSIKMSVLRKCSFFTLAARPSSDSGVDLVPVGGHALLAAADLEEFAVPVFGPGFGDGAFEEDAFEGVAVAVAFGFGQDGCGT